MVYLVRVNWSWTWGGRERKHQVQKVFLTLNAAKKWRPRHILIAETVSREITAYKRWKKVS